jgi:hypothetical protein
VTDLEKNANAFITNAKGQWEMLVKLARATSPRSRGAAAATLAQAAGVGKSTLLRKLEAIHTAQNQGITDEKLIEMGQRAVLAKFVTDKRNGRQDEQVVLKWLVAPENRNAAHENAVRVAKLLHFTTSDEYWNWLNAQISGSTDEEILHSGGEGQRAAQRG